MKYILAVLIGANILFNPLRITIVNADYGDKVDRFMDELMYCESGGNPNALNPNDGGSRSVGILQFKDKTFELYLTRYFFLFPKGGAITNPITHQRLARQILLEDG